MLINLCLFVTENKSLYLKLIDNHYHYHFKLRSVFLIDITFATKCKG
jgi:hypothetical protein